MLGSLQDAEEVAQDALLRAWQLGGDHEVDSPKAWLVAVSTRGCLDRLRKTKRRRGLGAAPSEVTWLEPAPDALFELEGGDSPEDATTRREQVGLAFVVALQLLSPRQRAAVLLVDVLGWTASETSTLLDTSAASVNSLLQRGRQALSSGVTPSPPPSSDGQDQLRAFVAAWESGDPDRLRDLLAVDARLWMPPEPCVVIGRTAILELLAPFVRSAPESFRLRTTSANGLPAVAIYKRGDDAHVFRGVNISVLTIEAKRITGITRFTVPALFRAFGLPTELGA